MNKIDATTPNRDTEQLLKAFDDAQSLASMLYQNPTAGLVILIETQKLARNGNQKASLVLQDLELIETE